MTSNPRIKSPTHTVIAQSRGNGQPGGQLDVGQAARAVDEGVGYFAAMGEADRAKMLEAQARAIFPSP